MDRIPSSIDPHDNGSGFLAVRFAVGLIGTAVVLVATFLM